jgi:hypothetical protein
MAGRLRSLKRAGTGDKLQAYWRSGRLKGSWFRARRGTGESVPAIGGPVAANGVQGITQSVPAAASVVTSAALTWVLLRPRCRGEDIFGIGEGGASSGTEGIRHIRV